MLLSLTLCASLLLPLFPLGAKATEQAVAPQAETPFAELTLSPNRTKGIVSMTFDDGSIPTAQWLNEKFKQYDLYGSTMLITSKNLSSKENIDTWNSIYADGRLEPQCHTYTHLVLPSDVWANANNINSLNNNTEENYIREIYDSGVMIEQTFGKFPLCIAPSNNTMSPGGMAYVKQYYYAMRQGSRYNAGELQSLDPIPGSDARGGWYNLLMSGTSNSEAKILDGLNTAARSGGWLVVMCHGIGASSGDTTYEKFEPVLQKMSTLQESGLIWVTTFGNATKYIRQRQNTQVNITKGSDTSYRVSLSMSSRTADGLPLPKDEFNLPLTVRFRLPEGATHLVYNLGDGEVFLEGYEEDGVMYAYLNMLADVDEATVRFCNAEGQDILEREVFTLMHGVTMTDTLDYSLYVKADINLLSAKIADGETIEATTLPKKTIDGEEYFVLSYTSPLSKAPLPFSITLRAHVDGKEGVQVFRCSLLDYFASLLEDTESEQMRILALNAMIYLRDIANAQRLSVDTTIVQEAILKYHYAPTAPDEFKEATILDTSSIQGTLLYDFTDFSSLVLKPNAGVPSSAYSFYDGNGNKLSFTETEGRLIVSIPLYDLTDTITVIYENGSVKKSIPFSLADDFARVKSMSLISTMYISLYQTVSSATELP